MKRTAKLIILAVILAAAIGSLMLVKHLTSDNDDDTKQAEDESVVLSDCDRSDVTEISYKGPSASYTIKRSGEDGFILEEDPTFPLDSDSAAYLFTYPESIVCDKVLEDGDRNYHEYGLDDPERTIMFSYKDGKTLKLCIGAYNKYVGKYYACTEGVKRVYLIGSTFTYYYDISLDDLIKHEKLITPSEEANDIIKYEVAFEDGSGFTLDFIPEVSGIDDEGNSYTESESRWHKTLFDGTLLSGDYTDDAAGLYKAFYEDEHTDWIDHSVLTKGNLSEYGLDTPSVTVTITYKLWMTDHSTDVPEAYQTTDQTKVYFGSRLQSGEENDDIERYYRIEGGEIVYAVSESDFGAIFGE